MHELRTPLTQIIGYAEMLLEEVGDRGLDDLARDLTEIHSAALALQNIVAGLFDGTGTVKPESARFASSTTDSDPRAQVSGSLLIVDDEVKIRELMARRLGRYGHVVRTAADGEEALRKLGSNRFDLVLLDLLLPGTDGLEILQAMRRLHSPTELPVIVVSGLGAADNTVAAMNVGANDFVGKPIDFAELNARIITQLCLRRSALEVVALSRQLEIRNAFIRRTLGRYVSDEIADNLLDEPAGLEMRGEKRVVTILKTDLRGFSVLTESCDATQVVAVLNRYLGAMTEVVARHGGIVDEFQGDAMIALFGAPAPPRDDDARRAVAAAIEMQLVVPEINEDNRRDGLPLIEMGIGVATGEAVVGNIGTESRAKYGVVGRPINLAARIESYSLGGDVLIDESTRQGLDEHAVFEPSITIHPKGFSEAVSIYRVTGLGNSNLPVNVEEPIGLPLPAPIRYAVVVGGQVSEYKRAGVLDALSGNGARLRADGQLSAASNLLIEFLDERGDPIPGDVYAKVVTADTGLIRFTTRSGGLDTILTRMPRD